MSCASLGPLDPMPQLQAHSAQWQKWGPAVVDLSGDWRARLAARFPRKHMEIAEAMAPVEGVNLTFAASHVGAEGRGTATTRWLLTMEKRTKGKLLGILARECARGASRREWKGGPRGLGLAARAHFLDIGSNIGFYGMMAASLGCKARLLVEKAHTQQLLGLPAGCWKPPHTVCMYCTQVHFFDMQCACATAVADALLANGLQRHASIHPVGVSDQQREFPAEAGNCNGRYPQSRLEERRATSGSQQLSGLGRTMPLVQLLPIERLAATRGYGNGVARTIAKVDVEGNELSVLRGLLPYLERRLIAHLVVEVTTGYGFYAKLGVSRHDVAETFVRIMGFGYTLTDIHDNTTHSAATVRHFFEVSKTQVDFHLALDHGPKAVTIS